MEAACHTPWPGTRARVVWQAVTGRLNGLFLPSLQTFTIPLPSAVVKRPGSLEGVPVSGLALTSDALYVRDGWTGTTWQTASPTALPLNTSRPGLTRSGNALTCRPGKLARRQPVFLHVAGEWHGTKSCRARG